MDVAYQSAVYVHQNLNAVSVTACKAVLKPVCVVFNWQACDTEGL
jgi:hypothetical protein